VPEVTLGSGSGTASTSPDLIPESRSWNLGASPIDFILPDSDLWRAEHQAERDNRHRVGAVRDRAASLLRPRLHCWCGHRCDRRPARCRPGWRWPRRLPGSARTAAAATWPVALTVARRRRHTAHALVLSGGDETAGVDPHPAARAPPHRLPLAALRGERARRPGCGVDGCAACVLGHRRTCYLLVDVWWTEITVLGIRKTTCRNIN
jgi:hypothetical protein